jgi:hypothetical protein
LVAQKHNLAALYGKLNTKKGWNVSPFENWLGNYS